MKISVDGGGLGAKKGERFGNYTFADNLITALKRYDKKNRYFVYTFDKLRPRFAWSKIRLSIEEYREKKDVFLALNQAIPIYTSGKIISFCHGLSYYFYSNHYSFKDYSRLRNQLDEMLIRSDVVVVSSQKVKEELEFIAAKLNSKSKIVVLPFGIPFDMLDKLKTKNLKLENKRYFLFVGRNQPIKNIRFIKRAFGKVKEIDGFHDRGLILITDNCLRIELRKLYQNADALLTASFYESFNLPVLEALSQGCPVIGLETAIIPELKKYVNTAATEEEFVALLSGVLHLKKKPDEKSVNQLKKEFSWRRYVEKLVKLYR